MLPQAIYKHKAVDDLMALYKADFVGEEALDVIYDLRTSMHFFLGDKGDVVNFIKGKDLKLFSGDAARDIGTPYSKCVFWSYGQIYGENRYGYVGTMVKEDSELENAYLVKHIEHKDVSLDGTMVWTISALGSLISIDEGIYPFPAVNETYIEEMANHEGFDDIGSFVKYAHKRYQVPNLSVLNCALMLINCQNITYEKVDPPEKLNKKRRKKGKEEMVSYHVLNVFPLSHKKQTSSGEMGAGEKKRVHLCRGHFKTFTENAPLFGRYTGRFWWQPQVRGKKQKGIVHKDYNVEV